FLVRQTNRQELWRDLAKQVKAKIYLDWGKDLLWNQQAFSAMKVLFSSLKQRFRVFTLWLIAKAMVKALIKSKRG
ncbi:hypothetical protein, partial [Staphylococcus pasteuri_A]